MHRFGWVGLKGFFNPTHRNELKKKKKKIKLNPTNHFRSTHSNQVGSMCFTFFLITINIIIKLSIRTISLKTNLNFTVASNFKPR